MLAVDGWFKIYRCHVSKYADRHLNRTYQALVHLYFCYYSFVQAFSTKLQYERLS
jgi:hypothetical protein